ncbi:pyridoxamine 5'-phosphate oxidase family protein [Chryseosolibacter indicus]|uniref:Pyridoxamine 5'-phosphate oxidase family protein n=1 Tax=Chryseosolibacter indicus TaxID=2782351 RepID=A0ABS5VQK4_9BACT|nr:pyridoxamine 5'-phosphate oxidase family protein [Chryseosolibacter indicus]MBT1703683.1 pyridoxamine 5'-phosphate oxidase family protein [Chryseosolibacter indicus]
MKSEEGEDVQHLEHHESIDKLKELVKHNNICLFTTHLTDVPLQTRPMSVQEVDDEGNFWFLSDKDSNKNWEIDEDPRVQLFFSNKGANEYLSVYGHATMYTDRKKVEDIWSPIAKAWFQEGKDDPHISVIKVAPEDAYYWDTKNNKAVSLIKIMASVVGGRTMDDGIEGKMKF